MTDILHIGIDGGADGGLASVDSDGKLLDYDRMPTIKLASGFRAVNALEVSRIVSRYCGYYVCSPMVIIWIEDLTKHAGSSSAMRGMAWNFGILTGELENHLKRSGIAIRYVGSGVRLDGWQRKMLGRLPAKQTKPAALRLAKTLWPEATWMPGKCTTPQDGCVDAALIAEFGRRFRTPGKRRG